MKYGSVCSGVEAATVAWHGLGWEPQWFSEIDKFPSAVLAHHYPNVPNLGDMSKFKEWNDDPIDLLVGGTPCQSFSVAGLRKGLDDPRGNLMLTYVAIAARYKPRWLVWENVPGVLSSNRGRDFGTLLAALGKIGYGFAYRVLDAQYFGVAQRRRRVFVVGYLGDWRRAAAVLFERESLSGNPAPSREEGEKVAATLTNGFGERGVDSDQIVNGNHAITFSRTGNERVECEAIVPMQVSSGSDPELMATLCAKDNEKWGCNQWVNEGKAIVSFPINTQLGLRGPDTSNSSREGLGVGNAGDPAYTLQAAHSHAVASGLSVRRLTPTECERLQGFPDGFTQIPYRNKPADKCPDGPRYKALGNSMAVPVMRWIGERIQMVDAL